MLVARRPFVTEGDRCLSIFRHVYDTGALVFPENASVLEIGCAEADWIGPMLEARPDLQITGIDWRPITRAGTVVRGDVLTYDFPAASFDAVVGISSVEHIGLGHYDNDPLDVDGDRHCLERVVTWLKPGGFVYADVPYLPLGYRVHGDEYRGYDRQAIRERLIVPGLTLEQTWFASWRDEGITREPDESLGMSYIAILARTQR